MTLLSLKKFCVDHVVEKGDCYVLRINSLGVEFIGESVRAYNTSPFEIVVAESGFTRNFADQVIVSINNRAKRTITIDTMSILAITHHPDVRKEIDRFIGSKSASENEKLEKWDFMLQEVDQVIDKASSAIRNLTMEMLFEDLLEMNRKRAIDIALTNRDEAAFYQLTKAGAQL